MAHGMYHYLNKAWKERSTEDVKSDMIEWRDGNAVVKVEKPSRIGKARMLGYKAKKGFVVVRVKINRGGRKRMRTGVKGRKGPGKTVRKTLKMNYQWVAEIRAARKYKNLEVLNSYQLGKDGKNYFYEVILVDPSKPEIKSDRTTKWMATPGNQKRAERGLTSAAKKSRGLRHKSPNLKVRPSVRAWHRQGK